MKKNKVLLLLTLILSSCGNNHIDLSNITPNIVPPSVPTTEGISPTTSTVSSIWGTWIAMGTSITEDNIYMRDPSGEAVGTYIPYLSELMGVDAPNGNYSISGALFAGHLLMYMHDYAIQNNGKTIYGYTHAALKDANLITIEGSINDFYSSIPLGEVGDTIPYSNREPVEENINSTNNYGGTKDGSFAGCIYTAITTLREINPKAIIIFITDNAGINSYASTTENKLGLVPHDYNDMMIAVAESMGCPYIDAGRTSGFEENLDTYLSDFVNHSEEGGRAYAETIYEGLCKIKENI